MMNIKTLTVLIGAGLMTTACGTGTRGLESVHQPVVSRADYAFDVFTSGEGIASGDEARLVGWFDALNLGYGDKVAIDFGQDYANGAARGAINGIVARYGLLVQDMAPTLAGSIAPGTARVIVSRMKASVPTCPDWSGNKLPNFENKASSNYGCATNTNLATMIADPEDLIRGKTGNGTTDATLSGRAVRVYRTTAPTGAGGLKSESTGGR
jgi:pilus assembly protein CpaD